MRRLSIIFIIVLSLGIYGCQSVKDGITLRDDLTIDVFTNPNKIDFKELITDDGDRETQEKIVSYDLSSVDFNKVGEYQATVKYLVSKDKQKSRKVTVYIIDRVHPEIKGIKDIVVNVNSTKPDYLDGLIVTDNYDGDLKSKVEVDDKALRISRVGSYTVKLKVLDSSLNKTEKSIKVNVVDPNTYYQVSVKNNGVVALGDTNFNYQSFVNSVKNQSGEDLLTKGYTLTFDDSNVLYDTIGQYPIDINLFNENNQVVKTQRISISIVYEVTVELKENIKIGLYDEKFTNNMLISKVYDLYNQEVNLDDYLISLDQEINKTTLGNQTVNLTLKNKEGKPLITVPVSVTVVKPFQIQYNYNFVEYNSTPNLNDTLINKVMDYNGKGVNLEQLNYTIEILGELDTSTIGSQEVIVVIKNSEGIEIQRETLNINVRYFVNVMFHDDLYINYGDKDFDLLNLVSSYYYTGPGYQYILWNENYFLETLEEIDVYQVGVQTVTFIVKDINGKEVFRSVEDIEISKEFNIVLNQNLSFPNNDATNFNYLYFVHSIVDSRGREIELGKSYQLLVDGYVNPYFEGRYDLTYSLTLGYDEVLAMEDVTVEVVKENPVTQQNLFIESKDQIFYFYKNQYYNDSFIYTQLVNTYDSSGNLVNLYSYPNYHYHISNRIDFNRVGNYEIYISIYDSNNKIYIDSTPIHIVIYDKQYDIDIDSLIEISTSQSDKLDVFQYIRKIVDLSGNEIKMTEPLNTTDYPSGGFKLENGLILTLSELNSDGNPKGYVFKILDDQNNIKAVKRIAIDNFKYIEVDFKMNYYVRLNDLNFNPLTLIRSIKGNRGQEIKIGTDILVEYSELNVTSLGYKMIEFTFKDVSGNILLTKNIRVAVINTSIYYELDSKYPNHIDVNAYNHETFNINDYINGVVDYNREYIPLENGYSLTYTGTINFNEPGEYILAVNLVNSNQESFFVGNLRILVVGEYDIIFNTNMIEIPLHQPFEPLAYIHNIINFNEDEYKITTSAVSTRNLGIRVINYRIVNKQTNKIVYEEQILLNVYQPIALNLMNKEIELNASSFDPMDLIVSIIDVKTGENTSLEQFGLRIEVEGSYDLSKLGEYYLYFIVYDEDNNIVYSQSASIYVISYYTIFINDPYIDITKPVLNPLHLVTHGMNTQTGIYFTFTGDYQLSYEGHYDANTPGIYDIKYILKNRSGKILNEVDSKLFVIDYSVGEIDYTLDYNAPNNVKIAAGQASADNFDIKNYMYAINSSGESVTLASLGSMYKVNYYNLDQIDFNTKGTYYLQYTVYHHARVDINYTFYIVVYII